MTDTKSNLPAGPTASPSNDRSKPLLALAALLALVALGVSGYLSVQSLTGGAVAGCGGEGGCAAVLASPWSKVGPVPVSLLGLATYLAVLIGLGLGWGGAKSRVGDFLLLAAAPAMLIAAVWFTYIQIAKVGEICPYCMVDHGIGVVLAVVLPVIVLGRPALSPAAPLAVGAIGCVAVIGVQHTTLSEQTQSTENLFVDRDGDTVTDGRRFVSMFGGAIRFYLDEAAYHGNADAEQVVGLAFDYACPHCRATHALIDEAMRDDPDGFAVVSLPLSIDEAHNPHLNSDNERFDESYELAVLSLAVAAIDRDRWKQFDRWLFSEQTITEFPREAAAARAKAAELVGEAALAAELEGEARAKHEAVVDRNIALTGLLPEDGRYIPIITSPGAPRHLTERFYEPNVLYELLEQAAAGLEAAEADASDDAAP